MNKGIQTALGIILFVFLAIPTIGTVMGVSEANAFNTSKVELIQRVRETGHDSTSVEEYKANAGTRFEDYTVTVTKVVDNSGEGMSTIAYGDEIEVTISAKGSGSFLFTKSDGLVEEEELESNKPVFQTTERLIVDRRAD